MAILNIKILKTINILYVEDEDKLREQELKAYKKLFKTVFSCENGLNAWNTFKDNSEQIDIIVTDINMPNLTGLEFLQKASKISKIPFILTSAYDDSKYLQEAIELGVKKYIVKPINIKQLIENIQIEVQKNRKEQKIMDITQTLFDNSKDTQIKIEELSNQNILLKNKLAQNEDLINNYICKVTTNKNGIITNISKNITDLLFYTKNDLLEKNIDILQDSTCPNGSFQKQMLNSIHTKQKSVSTFIIKNKSNKINTFTVETSALRGSDYMVDSYEFYFNLKLPF